MKITTKFENQVNILFEFDQNFGKDNPVWFYEVGNNLALYSKSNLCVLTPKGRKEMSQVFGYLLALLGVKDSGFRSMREILIESQKGDGVMKKWANKQLKKLGIN
jgi:hypothetical protein